MLTEESDGPTVTDPVLTHSRIAIVDALVQEGLLPASSGRSLTLLLLSHFLCSTMLGFSNVSQRLSLSLLAKASWLSPCSPSWIFSNLLVDEARLRASCIGNGIGRGHSQSILSPICSGGELNLFPALQDCVCDKTTEFLAVRIRGTSLSRNAYLSPVCCCPFLLLSGVMPCRLTRLVAMATITLP